MASESELDRISRRRLLGGGAVLAAGAAGLALVGCGDDDDGDDGGTGGSNGGGGATTVPGSTAEKPTKGGTLRLGKISDIILKSGYPYVGLAENGYLQDIPVESLVVYKDTLTPEPVLVERYEYNTDRSKLTMTIKNGVTFHNGAPLTPEDVFFGISLMQNPAKYNVTGTIQLAPFSKFIVDMKRVDARVMEFTFDKPRPNMDDFFAQMRITQAASYEKLQRGEDVQGTGAYMWKSWRPAQGFNFVANPNWHGTATAGGPYLDGIDVRLFADPDALGLAYEAGDLDVINGAPAATAKKYRDLTVVAQKSGLNYLGMNVTNPILKDPRVRQAVMWSVDRKRLVEEIGESFGTVTNQPWPKSSPAFDPKLEDAFYDTAKAKSLLQQAGYTGAKLVVEHRSAAGNIAAVIKENMEASGFKVDLAPLDPTAFINKLRAREMKDLWITTHSFSDLTPLTNFQQTIPYQAQNPSWYASPDYLDIQKKLETLDPNSAAAKEQYVRFNKLWLEDPWITAIAPNSRVDLYAAKVRGQDQYTGAPGATQIWSRMWKKA